jgi:hypothetical protein
MSHAQAAREDPGQADRGGTARTSRYARQVLVLRPAAPGSPLAPQRLGDTARRLKCFRDHSQAIATARLLSAWSTWQRRRAEPAYRARIRPGLRNAHRSDRQEAFTLLNWPDARVHVAKPGPATGIQAGSDTKIRNSSHPVVTFTRMSARKTVELRGFEPLTFCMPYKSLPSRNVAGCGSTSSFNRRTSLVMA